MEAEKLIMTLKVRDEEDILEANLRYHLALGVDSFVVTDNGSEDGTLEILSRFERAGLVHVMHESGSFRRDGRDWLSRMAQYAATELGATWVIHNDADEFWWPLDGTLKQVLADVPHRFGVVIAPRAEFVGRPDGPGTFAERLIHRETRSLLRPKVAHRAYPNLVALHDGAHEVALAADGEDPWPGVRPPGRAVLRGVRHDLKGPDDGRLAWAPQWPLRIFHFPVRSYEQYARRVELNVFDGAVSGRGPHARLRELYEAGELQELYDELVFDDEAIEHGLAAGTLVADTRIRDRLAISPDPLAAAQGATERERQPVAAAEAPERAEVELDAMQSLARTNRALMIRLDRARARAVELVEDRNAIAKERAKAEQRADRYRRRVVRQQAKLAQRSGIGKILPRQWTRRRAERAKAKPAE